MIERLNAREFVYDLGVKEDAREFILYGKINQLVDAVNELQRDYIKTANHLEMRIEALETPPKEKEIPHSSDLINTFEAYGAIKQEAIADYKKRLVSEFTRNSGFVGIGLSEATKIIEETE